MDFTESALVALWFACGDAPDKDRKVFILDIGDHQVAANGRKLSEDDLFSTERVVYYEPDRSLGPRIIAQQSVFVICNPPRIPDCHVRFVVAPKQVKDGVREHSDRLGVSERVLFGDVPGLARANARHTPLRRTSKLTPEKYKDQDNRAYWAQRYDDALGHYESFAAALPDVAQTHCLVGDTLSALGRFAGAVDAYTRAVQRSARPIDFGQELVVHWEAVGRRMLHTLYCNRGNAHAATGNHVRAIADFDRALKHGNELRRNVQFNRGNSKYVLERFVEAFGDFEASWSEREGSDTALALGNCRVMIGGFPEALARYLDGVTFGEPKNSATHRRQNAEHLRALLSAIEGHDPLVRHKGGIVYVETTSGAETFPFAGNRGNAGNTPSGLVSAHGREGYEGRPGFAVVMLPRQH